MIGWAFAAGAFFVLAVQGLSPATWWGALWLVLMLVCAGAVVIKREGGGK